MSDTAPAAGSSTEPIKAVKLKHPIRTTFAVLIVLVLALFIWDAATRDAYQWDMVGKYLFDRRISQAALYTLALTVLSMALAIVMGLILAVMRLSDNPVLRAVSWAYLWLFRGTPVYVQLVFWGLLSTIYHSVTIGIPFTDVTLATFAPFAAMDLFWIAVLGLAFNEAAYMAEIVRSGILSVHKGQDEAARALGMSWRQTMLRIVIPQSMRVIIPPTGNEIISMLKTTSLVTAAGFSLELYARTRAISAQIYATVPLLIVASIWYLVVTSILMIGQYYLERYYGRGVAPQRDADIDVPPDDEAAQDGESPAADTPPAEIPRGEHR
ncbi:amino acid ABC transporter membrane protein, PAAT family [Paramicrobacterium humi]|uniref:Amino acid ABC transporter membrane protein, PAAT family n=1 Tax=Paramicrobacterium humi TaxID=640635 RepID=A0A1H4P0K6_9MICO|nr:amino acid ABC transporter permease [Microbacterium humi]SEC00929.1 amino acid ABC transporter membrane protein, PAAT family [Microbacterium humi]